MSVTKYRALLVTDKPQTENLMRIYLKKAGINDFSTAYSQREAVALASKEYPHFIILHDDLPDASMMRVLQALRALPELAKAFVFVIKKCTPDEIEICKKSRVSAVLAKPVEPNVLIDKISQRVVALRGCSPYGIRGDDIVGADKIPVRIPVKIVGKMQDHLVCQSQVSASAGTAVTVVPQSPELDSFKATFITGCGDSKEESFQSNYFSLNDVTGKGRKWLMDQLIPLDKSVTPKKKRILLYENCRERVGPFRDILTFHGIDSDHVDSVNGLVQKYRSNSDEYGAVYFSETLMGALAISWEKLKTEIAPEKRPIEITATSAQSPVPKSQVVWLKKPFGIEQVIQSFETASFARSKPLAQNGVQSAAINKTIPCSYVMDGRLISLDEQGGILLMKLKPAANCQFSLGHALFAENILFSNLRVVEVEPLPQDPNLWTVRFAPLEAGKDKYWIQMQQAAANYRKPAVSIDVAPVAVAKPVAPAAVAKPVAPAAVAKPVAPAAVAKPVAPAAVAKPVAPAAVAKPAVLTSNKSS